MFVLLLAPAQGDELQGLKRGIIEISDLVLVTKADGALLPQARNTQSEYISALKYIRPRLKIWRPQVLQCSAHTGEGVPEVWETMLQYWHIMQRSGQLKLQRDAQLIKWMWQHVENLLVPLFKAHPAVQSMADRLNEQIVDGTTTPGLAAEKLLRTFLRV